MHSLISDMKHPAKKNEQKTSVDAEAHYVFIKLYVIEDSNEFDQENSKLVIHNTVHNFEMTTELNIQMSMFCPHIIYPALSQREDK